MVINRREVWLPAPEYFSQFSSSLRISAASCSRLVSVTLKLQFNLSKVSALHSNFFGHVIKNTFT